MNTVHIVKKFDGGFAVCHGGQVRATADSAVAAFEAAENFIAAFERQNPTAGLYVQHDTETEVEFRFRTATGAQPDAATLAAIEAEATVWKDVSFPNGSNYRQQAFVAGERGRFHVRQRATDVAILDGDKVYHLPSQHRGVGPGVELGPHFCTRDQALVAFA